jgi:hypothetical protein
VTPPAEGERQGATSWSGRTRRPGPWRLEGLALPCRGPLFLGALWGFIRPVNTFFALASVLG